MVESSGWSLPLPNADIKLFTPPTNMPHLQKATVLRELPFDHHRMTSGVLLKLSDGSLQVLLKGSYEKISQISNQETVPEDFKSTTARLAADCFYVLGVASRSLDKDVDVASLTRDDLEADLSFAGLLMFRNEMKHDSPDAIKELRDG